MRVASILTVSVAALVLTACGAGGGGGPDDLDLGGPTSAPVTTTTVPTSSTTAPAAAGRALAARARFAQLAIYETPDAPQPKRVLENPWTPKGAPRERIPQVLLVDTRQSDGWVKVKLPDTPQPTDGWVRGFDVRVSTVTYRMRIALSRRRVTIFNRDDEVFHGPIALVTTPRAAAPKPGTFYVRRIKAANVMATTLSPYTYHVVKPFSSRVPLGTPVEIVR